VENASPDQRSIQDVAEKLERLGDILTNEERATLSKGILLCFVPGPPGQFPEDCLPEMDSVVRKLTERSVVR